MPDTYLFAPAGTSHEDVGEGWEPVGLPPESPRRHAVYCRTGDNEDLAKKAFEAAAARAKLELRELDPEKLPRPRNRQIFAAVMGSNLAPSESNDIAEEAKHILDTINQLEENGASDGKVEEGVTGNVEVKNGEHNRDVVDNEPATGTPGGDALSPMSDAALDAKIVRLEKILHLHHATVRAATLGAPQSRSKLEEQKIDLVDAQLAHIKEKTAHLRTWRHLGVLGGAMLIAAGIFVGKMAWELLWHFDGVEGNATEFALILFVLALFAVSPAVLLLLERPLAGIDQFMPGGKAETPAADGGSEADKKGETEKAK